MAADVQEISGTKATIAARLCNFPTGQSKPIGAHRQWLEAKVKPIIASNPAAWVDLIGHASRQWSKAQGTNAHTLNKNLSYERCQAVKGYVKTFSSAAKFNVEISAGDNESVGPKENDGYDRAVEILVYSAGKPSRPDPPKPVATREFEIRVVGGGSASIIAQTDDYFFQIVDLRRRMTAFFFYTGGGIGISIPKIPGPGSATKAGPPTLFHTTRDAQLYMFNSQAAMYQDPGATIGPWSAGGTIRLSIDEIVDGAGMIFTVPGLIPIKGGWGIQMPGLGSVTKGVLAKVTPDWPFTGY
ncbi:hypothetical protein G3T14_06950 [Methylobacterium sp. BTF04]|uniref:hypothetical protein n=1 Tax=Methylobacterium sp. BTF04 TaxID=2708300 RepID=UPI0013D4DF04|nr:hypothetical protein [Methylobacterium sp. BTF04]NEU11866.1 hypothetical protein [Methylobacterium sp. BTF04]